MAQMRPYLLKLFSKSYKLSPSTASSEIKYKREKLQYDNIRVNRAYTSVIVTRTKVQKAVKYKGLWI